MIRDSRKLAIRVEVESVARKVLERTAEQAEDLGGRSEEEDEYARAVMSAIAGHGIVYVSERHVEAALRAGRER